MFEELLGCLVKHRSPGEIGAAAGADEASLEQLLHGAVDRDAADRFDVGLGDGLAVGDEGEGLEGGGTELFGSHLGQERPDPVGEVDAGHESPAARAFLQLDRMTGRDESFPELGDGAFDVFKADHFPVTGLRQHAVGRGTTHCLRDLGRGNGLGSGVDEGFDYLNELHVAVSGRGLN